MNERKPTDVDEGGAGRRPRLLTRRRLLAAATTGALGLVLARLAIPYQTRARPIGRVEDLSAAARRLVDAAFADVDPARLWDTHVHVVGFGSGGTGCYVHPDMRSHWHPIQRLQYDVYRAAAGAPDEATGDADYRERLFALHRAANPAGKLVLFAFDEHVAEDGTSVPERSVFHTPNEYVLALAAEHDDAVACASVHPYRTDALARLDAAVEAGAVAVKWLPSAMGIDPASERCDAFYARLAELGLPLISHAGLEKAVHAEAYQRFGNPLRLRRPLDAGVRVVVAHCASLGTSRDLDRGGEERKSFDLFLRLMGESQYESNLFGEISALTQINRCGRPLREMLRATELHPRLVNGSDYPLPAIDPLFSVRWLQHRGYLERDERVALGEIFDANPLLFDYVLKRTVRADGEGGPRRFAPEVFESARLFA